MTEPIPIPSSSPRKPHPWRGLIKWVLFAIVMVFVGHAFWKQLSDFPWRTTQFRPLPLALAALCLTIIYAARTLSFRLLIDGYASIGHCPPPKWGPMAVVAWVPQLGKYLPGQVFSIVGAVSLLRQFGISAAVGLSVVLVMDGLAVLTGLVTSSPLLLWKPVQDRAPYAWIGFAIVIIGGVIALLPNVYGKLVNFALVKTKRAPLDSMPPIGHYLGPVLLGFLQWALAGAALWLTAASVTNVTLGQIWLFTAISALGYTAGYVSPLPGGLGLREGIILFFLSPVIGAPAAVVAGTVRVIQTIVEIVMAAAGMIILRNLSTTVAKPAAS